MTLNLREPIALQEDYVGGANWSVCKSNATIDFGCARRSLGEEEAMK